MVNGQLDKKTFLKNKSGVSLDARALFSALSQHYVSTCSIYKIHSWHGSKADDGVYVCMFYNLKNLTLVNLLFKLLAFYTHIPHTSKPWQNRFILNTFPFLYPVGYSLSLDVFVVQLTL